MTKQQHGPDEDIDREDLANWEPLQEEGLRELGGEVEDVEDRAEGVELALG